MDVNFLLENNIINTDYFNRAFKFCFVRNPFDRLVSLYHYRQYDVKMNFDEFIYLLEKKHKFQNKFYGNLINGIYKNKLFHLFDGGPSIISRLINFIPDHFSNSLPLPMVGPYNVIGLSQSNLQVNWITDESNECFVDFIGKVENFNKDMEILFNILDINSEIPHLNKTNHKNYRKYYNAKTRKIVEEIYKFDLETFNYCF